MKKLDSILLGIELAVGCVSMAVIAILVFATVICRYFLHTGILWADEVVVNLFVVMVMAGGALCFRYRKHTEMTLFIDRLPASGRVVLRSLLQIVTLVFLLILFYSGIRLTMSGAGMLTSVLRIPFQYIYVMIPIGTLLMLYEFIKDSIKRIPEERNPKE